MDDSKGKKDTTERVRRKVAKVRTRLEVAEKEHAQALVKGEQEVDRARLRAAKRQSRVAKDVARWSDDLARLEAKLARLEGISQQTPEDPHSENGTGPTRMQIEGLYSTELDASGSPPLRERAGRALAALRAADGGTATAQTWRAAAGMTGTTFLRARRELLDLGLVYALNADERNGRYTVTERSRTQK